MRPISVFWLFAALLVGIIAWNVLRRPAPYLALAQAASGQDSHKSSLTAKAPVLAPNQRRGNELLDSVRKAAPATTYDVRIYLRIQLAKGYEHLNPALSRKLLSQAFSDTHAITDMNEKIRTQSETLASLLALDSPDVERLLPMAEPAAREEPTREILRRYVAAKKYQIAVNLLLQQASAFEEFPYDLASSLMAYLPQEKEADRETLFSLAFASYKRHDHKQLSIGSADFPMMVIRFGSDLPPALVLEAVDEILKQAKGADAGKFTFSSPRGSASLGSLYDVRLFELLPMITDIDPTRAKQLLNDDSTVKDPVQRYPNGLKSLDPSIRDTPLANGESEQLNQSVQVDPPTGSTTTPSMPQGVEAELLAQQIVSNSAKDGTRSISDALNLPTQAGPFFPRVDALDGIARNNLGASPAVAFRALDEMNKALKDCPPLSTTRYLLSEANLLTHAGDNARGIENLRRIAKVAEEIYEDDSDADDPNNASKPYWPSTVIFTKILPVALKFGDDQVASIISAIRDPEIQMIEKVELANVYLGVLPESSLIEVKKKGRQSISSLGPDRN